MEPSEKSPAERWNLPDWRDSSQYPAADSERGDGRLFPRTRMSREVWVWEFLRRWKPYREDWMRAEKGGASAREAQEALSKYRMAELMPPQETSFGGGHGEADALYSPLLKSLDKDTFVYPDWKGIFPRAVYLPQEFEREGQIEHATEKWLSHRTY